MTKVVKRKRRVAAVVTILEGGRMTKRGRHAIALWLRRHGAMLEKYGSDYSKRFTGRYHY